MSSILEALRELESDATPTIRQPRSIPVTEPETRRGPIIAGVVLLGLVAGGAVYFLEFRRSPQSPGAAPQEAAAPQPAAAPPAVQTAAVQPRAREAKPDRALPPAAPAAVPPAVLDAEPPRAQVAAPGALPTPVAQEPVAPRPVRRPPPPPMPTRVVMPPMDPVPPPRVARRPSLPRQTGEPLVDVQSIDYVAGTSHRTATIAINGDSPIIVHEGETIGGLDVQLILPDRVYLRHSGSIFAIDVD